MANDEIQKKLIYRFIDRSDNIEKILPDEVLQSWLYVAFTRAKEHLYLSSSARRLIYGRVVRNHKSRFLTEFLVSNDLQQIMEKQAEIQKAEGEIKVGSKVNHTFFGYGLVIAADEKFIQILFEKDNTIRKITKDHPTISLINE